MLTQNQTYYYAIKALIEGAASEMSNVAIGTCQGSMEVDCS